MSSGGLTNRSLMPRWDGRFIARQIPVQGVSRGRLVMWIPQVEARGTRTIDKDVIRLVDRHEGLSRQSGEITFGILQPQNAIQQPLGELADEAAVLKKSSYKNNDEISLLLSLILIIRSNMHLFIHSRQ